MTDIRNQLAAHLSEAFEAQVIDAYPYVQDMGVDDGKVILDGAFDLNALADRLIGKYAFILDLPEPNGMRGSGSPAWWITNPYTYRAAPTVVNPTESYNRNDDEVLSLYIGLGADEWPLSDALVLAMSILAAIHAAEAAALADSSEPTEGNDNA